jgi:hypothetical protein
MCPERKSGFLMLLCAVLLFSGCGSTNSENIKSKAIHAKIEVKGENNSTRVDVGLTIGSASGTSLVISGPDSLIATARGVSQTLTKVNGLLGDVGYSTTFNFNQPGTEIVVNFDRPDDTGCPNSRISMPDPFTITSPASLQVFTSQSTIPVAWTPASTTSGTVDMKISTRCTNAGNNEVNFSKTLTTADNGTASVPVATILPTDTYDTTKPCTSDIEITRSATGTLDPNYGEGGTITGIQSRTITIFLQQ